MPRFKFNDEIESKILIQCRADMQFSAPDDHSSEAWKLVWNNLAIGGIS